MNTPKNPRDIRNVLLVYPIFPRTYWGMQYYLPLAGRKALMPPLGLITIAALTPPSSQLEFRLVDLNCDSLDQETIEWADMVMFSGMLSQKPSMVETAERCRNAGKWVVFGGPFPTACPEECKPHCDVMVLNEGEITWPLFLEDLKKGILKPVYTNEEKPDLTFTPTPRFDLLKVEDYGIMPVQFSRGCPFQCEFCDIIVMYGRKPRMKTPQQLISELEAIYQTGYRGIIFVVDDNFIGNIGQIKKLLPILKEWNEKRGNPFVYGTEASLNIAQDPDLIKLMVEASFIWIFVGIETPSIESLKETKKFQNIRGSITDMVKVIQNSGLLVYGGFIIGFDHDNEDIFEREIEFIKQSAISNAMIGPLVALPGTPLFHRMKAEGRLIESGNAISATSVAAGYTNIQTKIPLPKLIKGHQAIISSIYTPQAYFARTLEGLSRLPRPRTLMGKIKYFLHLGSLISKNFSASSRQRSLSLGGILDQLPSGYKWESLKFALQVLWKRPEQLPRVFSYILTGYHYYKFTFDEVMPALDQTLADLTPPPQLHSTAA